ncbi:pentapeptide repeat-containing protein [Nostoc sp. DSM 114160]
MYYKNLNLALAKLNEAIALMNRDELLKRYAVGERDFSGVDLSGVNLKGVELYGVNLSKANLSNVKLGYADITCSNLQEANLSGVNLDHTRIDECNLTGANLRGIDAFQSSFEGSNLTGADLSQALLRGIGLQGVNLSDTNWEKANIDSWFVVKFKHYLKKVYLKRTVLYVDDTNEINNCGANLTDAIYYNSDGFKDTAANDPPGVIRIYPGADLSGLDFSGCNLRNLDLQGVNLSGSNLRGANLIHTDLRNANLTNTDLRDTYLRYTDLQGAILCNTIMPEKRIEENQLHKVEDAEEIDYILDLDNDELTFDDDDQ